MKKLVYRIITLLAGGNNAYYIYPPGPTPIIYVKYKNRILVV